MVDLDSLNKAKSVKELLEFSIINIDKPAGCTSFDVDTKIKRMLGLSKTSHFGTLDPMVTGVLPIGLNRACKLLDYFMHRDKVYVGEMRLHSEVSRSDLEGEMAKFIGVIVQKPPVKSCVKRVDRERRVNKFEILGIDGQDVKFLADVQAGTYIRKLIHDLGEEIGGAQMSGLRRIRAGMFEEKDLVSVEEFEKAVESFDKGDEKLLREILIPAEIISELYPVVQVKAGSVVKLFNGKPLMAKDVEGEFVDCDVFVVFCNEKFIGVYRKVKEKDNIARANFVLQPIK
jgi:H/ACA ribonucleoprotein complex subunit 4